MVRVILVIIIYLTTWALEAQEKEPNFRKEAERELRAEFPSFRPVNFEFGSSFARDYDSELFDENYQNGSIEGQRTFKAALNMPFFKTKKWVLTGSFDYLYNEFQFKELENVSNLNPYIQNDIVNFHNFRTALSSTYFSTIFQKPVIYNASLILDGNDKGFERFKGLIGLSVIMKRTESTTITLGAIVFVDKTAQIPFFPTFTYNHRFKGSIWELDFILPQRLMVRRPISKKGRLSMGSTLGGNGFYVNVNSPLLPDVFEYSQIEINTGLIYEHKVSPSVVATVKGGMSNFISSRLTEKGSPNRDYIYANTQGATAYFNLGFSYNPFARLEKN